MFKFKNDISETKNAIDAYVDKLDFEKELRNMNILPLCDIQSKKNLQKGNKTSRFSNHDD